MRRTTIGDESTDFLSELSRATTAYHDAPADLVEYARQEYMEALHNFNQALGGAEDGEGAYRPSSNNETW